MQKPLRTIVLALSIFALVAFAVFLVNQTVQVVGLADRVHPALGTAALWTLLFVYAVCLLVPLAMVLRLPRSLRPPASEASPEFEAHLTALGTRLRGHPLLKSRSVSSRAEIEAALGILDGRADEIIRGTASRVFIMTAVSQNGSLDGLMVLLAQTRMLWQIAHVYHQRPAVRDLAALYANVASTAFVATQIDDLDLAEQVQPLVTCVLGSAAGAVPGLHAASSLLVNSVVTGTANAFLTLRVGIIAKRYSGALVLPERRLLRRMAVSQASQMLGAIACSGAGRVGGAVWAASKTRAGDAARGFGEHLKQALRSFAQWFGFRVNDAAGVVELPQETGPEFRP